MFSSFFSSFGSAIGKFLGGGILSSTSRFLGKWFGELLDGEDSENIVEYYKIARTTDNLFPVSDAAGKIIPLIFGKTRVEGQLIWSSEITEVPIKNSATREFAKHTAIYNSIDFLYYCSFAIAICEGPISSIERVWTCGRNLDLSLYKYSLYLGSEDQLPDPLIEKYQKNKDFCPAFRNIAYIVFHNFPLIDFGNKLPFFSFEVERNPKTNQLSSVSYKIKALNIIPGSGEFVYDTKIQSKKLVKDGIEIKTTFINRNNREKVADAIYSLNYLQKICPKTEWVAPVVCWFANSLNIKDCEIFPAIEFNNPEEFFSEEWNVSGLDRRSAREISKNSMGNPNYGGTVNDASLLRYLSEIKSRGLKIMFYPMIFLDLADKPWRGHITGSPNDVQSFFRKEKGYNNFILHYANLVKEHVDAFIIGSELKSITSINDAGNFPSVNELCILAEQVKKIMGEGVKISYAADWSEYHHTDAGWYHLDDLWASESIDFIGIDNYMPVTLKENGFIKDEEITSGFESGEGFNFYIAEGKKHPIGIEYAWKNLRWWWSNSHYNPNGIRTRWIPKSKKVWFTEYGFPSIDKSTNQPNVFFDPQCFDGGVPKFSNSNTDFSIQRKAIKYFIEYWEKNEFMENMFLWCFDARPYPQWPHSDIWSDSYLWEKGHWINGKIGSSTLANAITEISEKVGITENQIDVSMLDEEIFSLNLSNPISGLEFLNLLRSIYFFDIRDRIGGGVQFIKRNRLSAKLFDNLDLIGQNQKIEDISAENYSHNNFIIKYNKLEAGYVYASENIFDENSNANIVKILKLPFALSREDARKIGDILLLTIYRSYIELILPISYIGWAPGDIFKIILNNIEYELRIIKLEIKIWEVKISAIREEVPNIPLQTICRVKSHREDEGQILQVILPADFEYESQTSENYIYFLNLFTIRKPIYISNDNKFFTKIAEIQGGCSLMQVIHTSVSSSINFKIIDDVSYIDVIIVNNSPIERSRSLWDCSSMMLCNGWIFFAEKIIKISQNHYRLSKIIYRQSEEGEYIFPKAGDQIFLLDKMLAVDYQNSVATKTKFFKTFSTPESAQIIFQ